MICKNHDDAVKKVDYIRRVIRDAEKAYKYSDNEEVKELLDILSDIDSEIDDIADEVLDAKESGQKMEDRLREYREAIEGLGFVRNNSQQL